MIITPGTKVYDANGEEYVVGDFLGNGSFGFVNKLESLSRKELFALKTVLPGFANAETERSFFNEGEQALKIIHENVIRYYFFHDGKKYTSLPPYIIMEFANQGNLASQINSKIKTGQFFTNDELVSMFQQLINGMIAINGVLVHRDLKPDNILIHSGVLKISDFGLAKVAIQQTRTATFKGIGHLAFMAPEGWLGETNTIQMDIYSMGLVFYQLATLCHAYEVSQYGDIVDNWKSAHLYSPVKPANTLNQGVSNSFNILIQKMVEKSNSNRCKDWKEVQAYLDKHNAPSGVHAVSIDSIVGKISQIESLETKAKLEAQKAAREKQEFENLVAYQLENGITRPLQEWADDFNSKSPIAQVRISPPRENNREMGRFTYDVDIAGRIQFCIHLQSLYNFKWRYGRQQRDYDLFNHVEEIEPNLNGTKIQAWGYIKDSLERGFNLFLLKKSDDIYGDWVMMFNDNSVFNRNPRKPEPFPFEISEFQKELPLIRATHIYNSRIESFTIEKLVEFINQGI